MTNSELRVVARMLRIALGYESREERIGKLLGRGSKHAPQVASWGVQFVARDLVREGLLTETSVVDLDLEPSA